MQRSLLPRLNENSWVLLSTLRYNSYEHNSLASWRYTVSSNSSCRFGEAASTKSLHMAVHLPVGEVFPSFTLDFCSLLSVRVAQIEATLQRYCNPSARWTECLAILPVEPEEMFYCALVPRPNVIGRTIQLRSFVPCHVRIRKSAECLNSCLSRLRRNHLYDKLTLNRAYRNLVEKHFQLLSAARRSNQMLHLRSHTTKKVSSRVAVSC